MLLASSCPACGRIGPAPCPACASQLRPAPVLPPPPGTDGCVALLAYEGAGRGLVTGLKYRRNRAAVGGLAAALASLAPGDVEAVTWAPTSAARRRQRGFDQSEVLARGVAQVLGLPCRGLLRRRPGPAQTGRSRAQRWQVPGFDLRGRPPRSVLLVDDVVTSGATAAAAARALRRGGAVRVLVAAVARTPQGHHAA